MSLFKKAALVSSLIMSMFLFSTHSTFAQQTEQIVDGTGDGACAISGVMTIRGIECIVQNILTIAVSAIGFAGFVMLIIGSFQFLLSGSDTKGVEGGKSTMTFAVIGLVLAMTSWMILNFIATFTGVTTITRFTVFFQ